MRFPRLYETETYRDMTTVFGGYNHQISPKEGQFYDMKNMTSSHFPILSPRSARGIVKQFTMPQGILEKEEMWWIDKRTLYRNGEAKTLKGVSFTEGPKVMAKMGAYIIVMPDKIWLKTKEGNSSLDCGYMENSYETTGVDISICDASGKAITWHDAEYYKNNIAKDGDYQMSVNSEGNPSLKVYSASTGIWMTVASPYVQISAKGIGIGFEKDDGVTITTDDVSESLNNIFVNADEDGVHHNVSTYLLDVTEDAITIPGIFKGSKTKFENMTLKVERKVPDLAFITECNNRLWGCSQDGHEIYCSKLGDVKNWNVFRGNSMDSWAATTGSDGKFTGAITYLGYPMFFKEDCLIKVSVSATGGHQTKETRCRGVQNGSSGSLTVLNETLYYKASNGVCAYQGSLPVGISDELGDIKYYDAVAGTNGDKYYISMRDSKGEYAMFCYDAKTGLWCKEDGVKALAFCKYKEDLYFIDGKDNVMKSVGGSLPFDVPEKGTEGRFDWFVESGTIGYSSPDNKYVGRINLRITLEAGSNVDFFIQYDSVGDWEHKFNMSGNGTKTYSIPFIPKRCDHFKYRIKGNGGCKIHSITKTIEEGSDGL